MADFQQDGELLGRIFAASVKIRAGYGFLPPVVQVFGRTIWDLQPARYRILMMKV